MAVNINVPSQVKTYANLAAFPASGSLKTIYIAEDTNKTYRWTGSVYVEISASASSAWGAITGTLSNQTDLQTALNTKQDSLVSGTNIKTIEGQSLLGSGNIDLAKSDVGLGNVDNTSDLNKPISTATQTALDAKEGTITAGTTAQYYRGDKTFQTLNKTAVGLGNVDNTSDANKPISTATQTALDAKQDTLVSGNNIKTVFSQSVVGSGNVGYIDRSFTQSVGSNASGETQFLQLTIPANTFSSTDKLSFFAMFSKTGTATAFTLRVKITTSASMPSGTTNTIASFTAAGTGVFVKMSRDMVISGGNLKGYPLTTSATTDAASSTVAIGSVAFDVTQTQYVYVSATPSSTTADIFRLEAFEIKNI
jgi:hypothetical protein